MADLTRRSMLGLASAAAVGTGLSWRRLTGADVPGRGDDALTIAILGTAQDAAARQQLVDAFRERHPGIPVRIQAVQGQDWTQFFTKILTMVAAGTPPDVCVVATEGAQLFADRLAEPLDRFVTRDADEVGDYFADVHPALVESFMYEGNLFMLPVDFNAANVYYSAAAFERAGVGRPADDWTHADFLDVCRRTRDAAPGAFRPFFWTNRLWGGVVPWLYSNGTSVLAESKAPGGDWLWDRFYAGDARAAGRSGGYRWTAATAEDPAVVDTFEFLRDMTAEGLGSSPAQGGGNELVARFAQGVIGMTPAGGFWVNGLAEAGMGPDDYDVTYFPRGTTQRHQFGAAGYAVLRTSRRKDEAWEWIKFCASAEGMRLSFPRPDTTPVRRSLVDAAFYADTGPRNWQVFHETLERFPDTGPIPAPPQQAAVEAALVKNVVGAVTARPGGVAPALATMQRDLELALRSR
ncbi:ABC transporter substrate-binding protein [Kineococcus terrestris]|uniref:ABC transporter substrate-binding protein n=1 Tax=Kineococcus terrestris TaxID=2044856 RepID=UPI0034DAF0F1